jgi:hypothetical protein
MGVFGHDGVVSPVSRGRKSPKSRQTGVRVIRPAQPAAPEPCDCPACRGEEFDPQELIGDLIADSAELLTVEDPLDAELFGASLVAVNDLAGEEFAAVLAEGLAAVGTEKSLAVLLALASVADEDPGAADILRLKAAGVPEPRWAAELREPVKLDTCRRFAEPGGGSSVLLCRFDRAGRAHGFIIYVDHTDCDAAADVILVSGDSIEEIIETIEADGRRAGIPVRAEAIDPPEFRWQVARALEARAVHDQELDEEELTEDLGDDEGPGYLPMATLLAARIRTLPEPARPPAPHGSLNPVAPPAPLPKLPAKRKKSNGAAPIYRIKVLLAESKPPIWRRLELPGDTGLATLHDLIQTAFDWEDRHEHVFDTPYGAFGVADRELGYRSEKPVTLEQVAPAVGDRIEYTYDFGDCWTHEIVVEKALEREPQAEYPRCVGGRRAAPPEDCGGIWGYEDLLEILADPAHPEHADRLEWLGLQSAAELEPDRFKAAEVLVRRGVPQNP